VGFVEVNVGFAGFALGGSLQKMQLHSEQPKLFYFMVLFFALMTPIGIAIGWILTSSTGDNHLAQGILYGHPISIVFAGLI